MQSGSIENRLRLGCFGIAQGCVRRGAQIRRLRLLLSVKDLAMRCTYPGRTNRLKAVLLSIYTDLSIRTCATCKENVTTTIGKRNEPALDRLYRFIAQLQIAEVYMVIGPRHVDGLYDASDNGHDMILRTSLLPLILHLQDASAPLLLRDTYATD